MATIRKKGNFQWHVQIRRKGFPVATKTFEIEDAAIKWARDIESKMDKGIYFDRTEAERTTLGDLINKFLKEHAPHEYKQREDGKEAYKFQCAHLKKGLGKYCLAAIDQRLVAKYRDDRLSDKWRGKTITGSTVKKELNMLSRLMRFAEIEEGIDLPRGNPVRKVRMPKDGVGRDRRLTEEEWKRLEAECGASRNRSLWPCVRLAIALGARQGELLNLQWKDVNKKRSMALLRETKNGDDRAVPLTSEALAVLNSLPVSITGGKVFNMARMTLYHAFIAAVKRAKISDYNFHDLRHEALSRLSERGDLSMLEIASISGHKTLKMLQRYTHLNAEKLAKKLG
ncbi:MAG: site-specific integrase [Gallionella sp.]|nr:site-specific integrase [Gallionella sp.]